MTVTSPTQQLSDEQWHKIKDLLPKNDRQGGPWKDHRLMIEQHLVGVVRRRSQVQPPGAFRLLAVGL